MMLYHLSVMMYHSTKCRDYEQHLRELDQRFQQTATVTMRDVGSEVTNRPGSDIDNYTMDIVAFR